MSMREDGAIHALRTAPRLRERCSPGVCAAHGGTFDPRGIGEEDRLGADRHAGLEERSTMRETADHRGEEPR